jgi:ABC-type multidrug transport system permease subunit
VAAGFFDVRMWRAPLAMLWATFAGTAMLAYFCLLQTLARNARGANLLSALVVFPLIMIGGSFFPFEAMPSWMAGIGRWTPNGLAVVRLKEMLTGTPNVATLALSAAGIGLPALIAFFLAARRLERGALVK